MVGICLRIGKGQDNGTAVSSYWVCVRGFMCVGVCSIRGTVMALYDRVLYRGRLY